MTIYLLRGAYANEFELQNYRGIKDLKVITTAHPISKISLPTVKLGSPAELNFPFRKQILNRVIGGEQWLLGLKKVIELGSILHTAETYTPYTHQAVELRKRGIISKLICTCWETIPHNNEKFSRLRRWKQEAYQYIDLFHTPTERAKQALVAEGVDARKIVVIPYGVDTTRFKPRKRKENKRPIILTVARLTQEKGMNDLELVARDLPEYDFVVVGQGNLVPTGKNISVKSIPYDQIHQVYQQADLFFLPSRKTATWEEQYGMVLVEAMATGLPIVATNSGAIPEVIGGYGQVVKVGDITGMVNAIKLSLSKKSSLVFNKKKFDSRQVLQKLRQLY